MKWRAWLYTLATAAVKAAADGFLLSIVAPEVSAIAIAKAVGIGALTSVAHILRESPLPRAEWSETERLVKLQPTVTEQEARAEKLETKKEVIEKLQEVKKLDDLPK